VSDFSEFLRQTRSEVEARLASWVQERSARFGDEAPAVAAVLAAVRELTLRGGKRFRPALLAAAYEGCGGEGGASRVVLAGVALELLQTYLLIHDDWMDGDDVRRGGPSAHAFLRERLGSREAGDAGAILAGDMSCAMAQEALAAVPAAADRVASAMRAFARMQQDVIVGQIRDLHAAADVARTHELKTASYTTVGPMAIGAALAGAPADLAEGLARFAAPLGVAFQVRDDLLGAFGDPASTGKPVLRDVARGKRTVLVAALDGDEQARAWLARLRRDENDADAARSLVERMHQSGARERAERELAKLLAEARARLATLSLREGAKRVLEGAIDALGERDR
jgi:geranylgeranyl diphosphate synthase type I